MTLQDVERREHVVFAFIYATLIVGMLAFAGCGIVRTCFADNGTYQLQHKGGTE